ncbi:hypothetical protein E2C01_038206 [Portunus trituberculatus]|uniref:Uncharacterized protein n=1 Tax=Portunus trituberculatus TaxID=210409 RepID=A0A5B7FDJ8_PORTR|nr:hypothetical protein [Portunus trituberculatus]
MINDKVVRNLTTYHSDCSGDKGQDSNTTGNAITVALTGYTSDLADSNKTERVFISSTQHETIAAGSGKVATSCFGCLLD